MNTNHLRDMICCRKSVRSYTGEPVGDAQLRQIRAFIANLKPLYPEIRVQSQIIERSRVRTVMPWIPPQMIAVFSEEKDGYLENVGFMYQQLELYLQSMGLGACWVGLGKPSRNALSDAPDGLQFVILMAFGHPKDNPRREFSDFRRLTLAEISDIADERLEPARLAPSSVNSQPWYFTHEGDTIGVYCAKKGLLKMMTELNRIDMGIALAHLYVAYPESFCFSGSKTNKEIKGYACIGSIAL